MDIYGYDDALRAQHPGRLAGVDEAGRGPLAGPVVAGAVVLPPGRRFEGLNDSKQVPKDLREHLFFEILAHALDIGIGISDHKLIDTTDVLKATKMAMEAAVRDLRTSPDTLLIDALKVPALQIKQFGPIKGDTKSAAIAAASIVAKYTRDRIMQHYHTLYPLYGFDRHKGYGTQMHLRMLEAHGPCPIHRKTFKKVMTLSLPF